MVVMRSFETSVKTGLHGVTPQKILIYLATTVRTLIIISKWAQDMWREPTRPVDSFD
jgi:hypothetical protein